MARRCVPIHRSELVQWFAARLREVRQTRGITQADLASQAVLQLLKSDTVPRT